MSKRKGLSADEKRRVILDIYHSHKEPFNLKEIEVLVSHNYCLLRLNPKLQYIGISIQERSCIADNKGSE